VSHKNGTLFILAIIWPKLTKRDNIWQKCSLDNCNAYLLFTFQKTVEAGNQPRCCCRSSRRLFLGTWNSGPAYSIHWFRSVASQQSRSEPSWLQGLGLMQEHVYKSSS